MSKVSQQDAKKSIPKGKIIGAVLGLVIGVVVATLAPPGELTKASMQGLGILICAILFLIFKVLPDYLTVLMMCCAWAISKIVPANVAFSAFSGTTWWLLISAFGIGYSIQKTGLIYRIVYGVLNLFPKSFRGQVAGLLGSGVIIGPMLPSIVVKAAIFSPLTRGFSDAMGNKPKSKGAAAIFAVTWLGFCVLAPAIMSSNSQNFMAYAFLPDDLKAKFTFGYWMLAMLPWLVTMCVCTYIYAITVFKPEEEVVLPEGYCREQLDKLGPMNRGEKVCIAVLLVAFILWVTERAHGINSGMVAFASLLALILFNVLDANDFKTKIPWDTLFFMGGVISIGSVISNLGINNYVAELITPVLSGFTSNVYMFYLALFLIACAIRFVVVSAAAFITVFSALLVPFSVSVGLNPWPVLIVLLSANSISILSYQNAMWLTALTGFREDGLQPKHTLNIAIAYLIIVLIAIFASVPFWKFLGIVYM